MDKKTIYYNIIKFFVGVFLLFLSFLYLEKHPAEKVSMFSGIQVMGQKIALMWYDIQGQDTALLEKKYNLQRYFNELLYTAEYTTGCEEGEVIDFINETKDTLKSLSLTEFSETEASYIQAINYIKDELQDACSVA